MTGPHPAIADAVAASIRIDEILEELADARHDRDQAVRAALRDGTRPAVIRKATGLSASMIRLIRREP